MTASRHLEVVDGLHMPSGRLCYAVIDNDGWQYPQLSLFFSKEKALLFIKNYQEQKQ